MKSLLAVVGDGPPEPVLETALLVARRFASHITGLHSPSAEYASRFGWEAGLSISSDLDRAREGEGHKRRDQAQSMFQEFMNARGVPLGAAAAGSGGPAASWFRSDTRRLPAVGVIGRVYDLIVVRQPDKLASIAGITLEAALFESGRPVLVAPKVGPPVLGEVVAIAWNGSAETAQTVALAMPFLKQAKRVVVVAVEDKNMPDPGPSGQELARALKRHGLNVNLRTAVGRQKGQGESFLSEATAAGADLLLKGAYARGRIRQLVFGGATRHIILASTIPLLIAR